MTELNWRHQTVIQALLSRGPLKEDQFHSIFTGLTGRNPGTDRQKFDDFLLRINKALSYVQLELRGCRYQYDGQIYYGVVNNVSDEGSKLGTKYSVPQLTFYKAIIEAIAQDAAAQGTISNIDVLNLRLDNQVLMGTMPQSQGGLPHVPPAVKNFSLSQKEKTLDELVRDQWLTATADNCIGLGVRSFLELRSWFRNNDVPPCEVCNEAGVKAALCEKEGCTVRIHQYCLNKMFCEKKGRRVCPGCGTQWNYAERKAEAVEDDEPNDRTQNQRTGGPKRKRLKRNGNGDGDVFESCLSQASLPGDANLRRSTGNGIGDGNVVESGFPQASLPGASNPRRSTRNGTGDGNVGESGSSQASLLGASYLGRSTRIGTSEGNVGESGSSSQGSLPGGHHLKKSRRNGTGDGDVVKSGSSQASLSGVSTPRRSTRSSTQL